MTNEPAGCVASIVGPLLEHATPDLLYVRSRGVRHGSAEVLGRLGRGEPVDAGEYTFRTSTQIETAAPISTG